MNRLLWSYAITPTLITIAISSLVKDMDLTAILSLSKSAVLLVHIILREESGILSRQCRGKQSGEPRNILTTG